MRNLHYSNGLQAMEWTLEERGLAGVSDLEGIPWRMPMDRFFEVWVETIFRVVAQRTGAQIKVGRKRGDDASDPMGSAVPRFAEIVGS